MATLALRSLDIVSGIDKASLSFPAGSAPYQQTAESKTSNLAFGFPKSIVSERVWSATDLEDQNRFIVPLNEVEISEIESGLASFKGKHQSLDQVSRESFPLPTLASKLKELAHQLHFGPGCVILRGLDPKKYTTTDNLLIYLGVASYIAEERGRQDSDGNMLIHIKDHHVGEHRQAPYSGQAMTFHNDKCAILAMYALSKAAKGGDSLIASSGQVYNTIAATRPDLISVLAEPSWPFRESANPSSHELRPLLFNFPIAGPAFCFNSRHLIRHAPRNATTSTNSAPSLTSVQLEALALVEKTARQNAHSIELQPGDIQLLNNFAVLHARDAFLDGEGGKERHLVRLWLKNREMAWQEPGDLGSEMWTVNQTVGEDGGWVERRWALGAEGFTAERISRGYEGCS